MKRSWSMCGAAGILGVALLAGGCGGGGSSTPAPVSTVAATGATVNADGTATSPATTTIVSAPAGAPAALANVAVTLQPSTVITAQNADDTTKVLTSSPTFTFQAPANATSTSAGTSSLPTTTSSGAVTSAVVAIEVSITGAAKATFSSPISIKLPVPGKADGFVVNTVYQNKNDGNGYVVVAGGPYTVAGGTITISVNKLCWFVGDPEFETGSTGSSGGSIR